MVAGDGILKVVGSTTLLFETVVKLDEGAGTAIVASVVDVVVAIHESSSKMMNLTSLDIFIFLSSIVNNSSCFSERCSKDECASTALLQAMNNTQNVVTRVVTTAIRLVGEAALPQQKLDDAIGLIRTLHLQTYALCHPTFQSIAVSQYELQLS